MDVSRGYPYTLTPPWRRRLREAVGGGPGSLDQLIVAVRAAVHMGDHDQEVADGVAAALAEFIRRPDLLSEAQRAPDPDHYRQHVVHVEDDGSFSIVALVWLPGQETPIHDHISWCVVGVYEGREYESRYMLVRDSEPNFLLEVGSETHLTGSVEALTPPGDIHLAANRGSDVAISIHIYGANIAELGSSIRRRYDMPVMRAGTPN
jgi:3-mercaptopropionate dioxygenase